MPKYRSTSPYELILADYHYGINAVSDDALKVGAVVLRDGETITVDDELDHPFLQLVDEAADKKSSKAAAKPAPVEDAPAEAPAAPAVDEVAPVEATPVSEPKSSSK